MLVDHREPLWAPFLCLPRGQIVEDAEAEYLAFFAGKTVGTIRAPDVYVYPAPFNVMETLFIAPWELVCHLPPTLLAG